LSELITKAVNNNNEIQVAMGNAVAAQGELMQIKMSIIPSVNGLVLGYSTVSSESMLPGYNSGFLPKYLFNLFEYMRSVEWAKASAEAASAAKDAVQLTIISQTAASYFTYLGQSHLLRVQEKLVSDLKELLVLSKIQYKKGLISLYTLQQYEQQYDTANANLPIIAQNVVIARNALRLLMNQNPGAIPLNYSFMNLKSNGIIPNNVPSEVLRNRPDVRQAEQQLIAANADIGRVTSVFFPAISFVSLAASNAHSISSLFSAGRDYWHEQFLLYAPLLAPEVPGQLKRTKALRYAALRNYVQIIRSAFKSVDNDLSAHDLFYKSLMAQEQNFKSSKQALNLATHSYEKGLYSYPTLLINRINLDNAEVSLTTAKLTQLITIVQLYEDLGGGYAYH
jgi:NodT family efflux transporter outer membrane factor (OMF) lipoprotein